MIKTLGYIQLNLGGGDLGQIEVGGLENFKLRGYIGK